MTRGLNNEISKHVLDYVNYTFSVTIQPLKTGPLMLILLITLIAIINLWTLKKRNQSASIKENQLI